LKKQQPIDQPGTLKLKNRKTIGYGYTQWYGGAVLTSFVVKLMLLRKKAYVTFYHHHQKHIVINQTGPVSNIPTDDRTPSNKAFKNKTKPYTN